MKTVLDSRAVFLLHFKQSSVLSCVGVIMSTKHEIKQLFYIHPLDADTNRVIAGFLQERAIESACEDKRCADGETRNVWELDYEDFMTVIMSRASLLLRCTLFLQTEEGLREFKVEIKEREYQAPDLRERIEDRLNQKIQDISRGLATAVLRPRRPHKSTTVRNVPRPPPRKIKPTRARKK